MGIEALEPTLNIYTDPLIYRVINTLYHNKNLDGFIMAGKLLFKELNLGSGGGWHRDSVGQEQFKALVYLTDVDLQHGPFQYFIKTSKITSMKAAEKYFDIGKKQNRLSDEQIALYPKNRLRTFCAERGTLIIANTRAIHRGMPISSGVRYALTTYSWASDIPKHILPFVNQIDKT